MMAARLAMKLAKRAGQQGQQSWSQAQGYYGYDQQADPYDYPTQYSQYPQYPQYPQSGHEQYSYQQRRSRPYSTMASSKQEWLVIVKDHPNSLDARMAVRETHLTNIKAESAKGLFTLGGGTLSAPPSMTDGKLLLDGSVVIAVADTEAEVRALLARDVYATTGVWDLSRAQIIPFKCAFRYGM